MALSAKGAECKSLGHRPREMQTIVTALKARNFRVADKPLLTIDGSYFRSCISRLQRFPI
jgi:hypothetical protein